MERAINSDCRFGTAQSPREDWASMDVGGAATPSEHLISPEIVYLLVCSHNHALPCSALPYTSGNYSSQAPLPSGFLVGLANGKHRQAGGREKPRYFSLSASGSIPACGWSPLWFWFPGDGPFLKASGPAGQVWLCFRFCPSSLRAGMSFCC